MPCQWHVAQARADEGERLVVAAARRDEVVAALVQLEQLLLEGRQLEEVVLLGLARQLDVVDRTAVALVDLVLGLEVCAARAVPAFEGPLVDEPVVAHAREHLLHLGHVRRVGGADEEVVARLDLRRQRLEALCVFVGQLLRAHAGGAGGVGDRLAMLVGAREEEHALASLAVVTSHDVGGDGRVGMPDMWRGVDVIDRRGHIEGHARPRLPARQRPPSRRGSRRETASSR